VHKNALFHTKYLKKVSGDGAQPLPRTYPRCREVHPLSRGTYDTLTPRLRRSQHAFSLLSRHLVALSPPQKKILATTLWKISEIDATRWLLWHLGIDFMKINFSRGSAPDVPTGGRPSSRMETASP